jgi:predicted N-acetyltransferase YhbS
MIRLVHETPVHVDAREALLDAAFGAARFAKTSERLREDRLPANKLAFVALEGRRLVGTVRLWNIAARPGRPALLLGPIAVAQDSRGRGVGAALMRRAIADAKAMGHRAILLVGDAAYYSRFGFSATLTSGLWLPGPVERDRFLGLELSAGALDGAAGLVSPTGVLEPLPDLSTLVAAAVQHERFAFAA